MFPTATLDMAGVLREHKIFLETYPGGISCSSSTYSLPFYFVEALKYIFPTETAQEISSLKSVFEQYSSTQLSLMYYFL